MERTTIIKTKKEKKDLEEIAINARKAKAEKMLYEGKVLRLCNNLERYIVFSETKKGVKYIVECTNLDKYTCSCEDFSRQIQNNKNHRCKHIILIQLAEEYSFIKRQLNDEKNKVKLEYEEDDYSF